MSGFPIALRPLAQQKQWVIWKYKNGRKLPFQSRHPGRLASSTDSSTWSTYDEAVAAAPRIAGSIGFVIGKDFGAFDLDDCRNDRTGVIDPWAQELLAEAHSYAEVTPSQQGIRIIGIAHGEPVHRTLAMPTGQVQIFRGECGRYITVSGDALNDFPLRPIDRVIDDRVGPIKSVRQGPRNSSSRSMSEIIARYRIDGWLKRELLGPGRRTSLDGQRGYKFHFKMACALYEHGVPRDEAFVCLSETKWNKHAADKPVWILIDKVWR